MGSQQHANLKAPASYSLGHVVHHMTSVHEQYFNTIYSDFAAKIEVISRLIKSSPAEQGRIVENVVRDLLEEYLPARYSFGTGFVIDSGGQQSRQCDIVIYDTVVSAGMLARTGPMLFPVESVYGVVEVKSTLNAKEIRDAFSHIASVKRLKNNAKPTAELVLDGDGDPATLKRIPSPPIGIVFGYRSDARSLITINAWFDRAIAATEDRLLHPDYAVSVQEGIALRYQRTSHVSESLERKCYLVPLRDSDGRFVRTEEGGQRSLELNPEHVGLRRYERITTYNGHSYNAEYKICGDKKFGYVLGDGPRTLIEGLNDIATALELKKLSGTAIQRYLPQYFGEALRLERIIEHRVKLRAIRDQGRNARFEIFHQQAENLERLLSYVTQAASALPESDAKARIEAGVQEVIRQYTALLLQATGINANEFAEWFRTVMVLVQEATEGAAQQTE